MTAPQVMQFAALLRAAYTTDELPGVAADEGDTIYTTRGQQTLAEWLLARGVTLGCPTLVRAGLGPCEVCWTASWEPVPTTEECDLKEPHGGEHVRCGYCWMRERRAQAQKEIMVLGVPPVRTREPSEVTRFEVIDHRSDADPFGRVFSAWNCRIELSYQDNGRTLKVFVDGASRAPGEEQP